MDEQSDLALHLLFEGKVQGVGFRYFVRQSISDMKISGWVRNLSDGRVEVLAKGSKLDLENFLELIKNGPSVARVNHFTTSWERNGGEMEGFRILATSNKAR